MHDIWTHDRFMMHDLRDALRRLTAKAASTAMAVMTLALGIGANTAIYSAASALLVRPLPVPDADRVVCGLAPRDARRSARALRTE